MVKFDFLGSKIEVGLIHLLTVLVGFIIGGIVLMAVSFLIILAASVNPEVASGLILLQSALLMPISAAVILLAGKIILKKIDKNKIKSLCAAYFILQVIITLILIPILTNFLETDYPISYVANALAIVYGIALFYLWLIIFHEWNSKKIVEAAKNGVLLSAITSVGVSGLWYLYSLNTGIPADVYYSIISNFIILVFMITPVVYYLADKKTLGKTEYFFAGAFILGTIAYYLSDFELYGRSYYLVALVIVYLWWLMKNKKN